MITIHIRSNGASREFACAPGDSLLSVRVAKGSNQRPLWLRDRRDGSGWRAAERQARLSRCPPRRQGRRA